VKGEGRGVHKIFIIADKIMPDLKLIGLLQKHFPEQEIVILRRDDMGQGEGQPRGEPVWGWGQHSLGN
jgi:hypothetical protein